MASFDAGTIVSLYDQAACGDQKCCISPITMKQTSKAHAEIDRYSSLEIESPLHKHP